MTKPLSTSEYDDAIEKLRQIAKEDFKKFKLWLKVYRQIEVNTNGCGPTGYGHLVPDFNLTKQCNLHDMLYSVKAYHLAYRLMRTGSKLLYFYSFFTKLFGKDAELPSNDDNNFVDIINVYYSIRSFNV